MRNIIQIIIILAILVTGGSLILTLVAKVRTAGNKMSCANNLHQLGIALENYYGTNKSYPPGTVQETNLRPEDRLSWLVTIWPYIQAGPGLRMDAAKPWNSTTNYPPFVDFFDKTKEPAQPVGRINLFQCPSNLQPPGPDEAMMLHYVGVAGVGSDAASLPLGAPGIGFFGYDRHPKKSDIIDGISKTIAVMETLREVGPWTAGGPYTVRGLSDPTDTPYLGRDGQWTTKHHITNVLFADCSVRGMQESTSLSVLEALATINGKENVLLPE
jgi:hypothetical protein